jgi:hypothetical protein
MNLQEKINKYLTEQKLMPNNIKDALVGKKVKKVVFNKDRSKNKYIDVVFEDFVLRAKCGPKGNDIISIKNGEFAKNRIVKGVEWRVGYKIDIQLQKYEPIVLMDEGARRDVLDIQIIK